MMIKRTKEVLLRRKRGIQNDKRNKNNKTKRLILESIINKEGNNIRKIIQN